MITKAIVEEVIDKYSVRVRIPMIDSVAHATTHTATENLNIALVCTLPGQDPRIRPGDVVFVALDESPEGDAIILGYLYREKSCSGVSGAQVDTLTVTQVAQLPEDSSIGNVTSLELSRLVGIRENIQQQLDNLQEQINMLTKLHHLKQELE